MEKLDLVTVHDALVNAWAHAKSDYVISLRDNGKDHNVTKSRYETYKIYKQALELVINELGWEAKEL